MFVLMYRDTDRFFLCVIAAVFSFDLCFLIAVLIVILQRLYWLESCLFFVSVLVRFCACIGYLLLCVYTPVDITILVFL